MLFFSCAFGQHFAAVFFHKKLEVYSTRTDKVVDESIARACQFFT